MMRVGMRSLATTVKAQGVGSAYEELIRLLAKVLAPAGGRTSVRRGDDHLVRSLPAPYYPGERLCLARRDPMLDELMAWGPDLIHLHTEGPVGLLAIHTDQGSVYTSKAYNEIIREAGIVRSCSRAGKPTDNPVNESLNGWVKEELFLGFGLGEAKDSEVKDIVERYVGYHDPERPCFSIGYRTPDELYADYACGRVERKDTFSVRVLDPTPKFVRDRKAKLAAAEGMAEANGGMGSSDAALFDQPAHVA